MSSGTSGSSSTPEFTIQKGPYEFGYAYDCEAAPSAEQSFQVSVVTASGPAASPAVYLKGLKGAGTRVVASTGAQSLDVETAVACRSILKVVERLISPKAPSAPSAAPPSAPRSAALLAPRSRRVLLAVVVGVVVVSVTVSLLVTRSTKSSYPIALLVAGSKRYDLQVATTPALQHLGLGNRASLSDHAGMLFVSSTPGERCFWMKNMRFSIDILWLSPADKVVSLQRDVPIRSPVYCASAQDVVELNAGQAKAAGIEIGTAVKACHALSLTCAGPDTSPRG